MDRPKVKIIATPEEFAALAPQWDELVAVMEKPNPFITHSWLSAWWKHFGEDNRLFIFTVWKGDGLLGIIPLMRTRFRIQGIFQFNCLHSLTNPHSPEFDIICRDSDLSTVIGRLQDHLERNRKDWDLLLLERISAESQAPAALADFFRAGATRINRKPWEGSYHIPIRDGFAEYFANLNKSFRKNIRNRNNKLADLGKPDFQVIRGSDPAAIDTFYRLENTGWKRENRSSIALRPRETRFYHDIGSRFAQTGEFNLSILSAGQSPLAAIYGLEFQNQFYFLKLGVDYDCPEADKLSPGQAILYHLIRYCFEEKLSGFDFCGPFTPYERQWTKAEKRKHQTTVYNFKQPKVKLFLALKNTLTPLYRLLRKYRKGDSDQDANR